MWPDPEFDSVPELPSPSTLYCLQPLGIGSETVESLTSFISRLAWSHRISLSCLLERIIAPLAGKRYLLNGGARVLSSGFSGYFRAINSTGETAAEWTGYLQQLTSRGDLSCLNLRQWRHVLSQRELLRQHKAWCAECFHEQLAAQGTLYEPLLWSIAVVTVCPRHKCPLQLNCVHCGRNLFHLSRRVRPGYCYRCGGSLLRARSTTTVSESDLWMATAAGQLVASQQPQAMFEPDSEITAQAIRKIIEIGFEGNAARFARAIGKQKNSVWGWCNSNSRMRLVDLLSLCYCLHLEPLDFVAPDFSPTFTVPVRLRPSPISTSRRSKGRALKLTLIETRLRKTLAADAAPSMQQVALSMGIHKRLLYRRLPDLCRAIALKHRLLSASEATAERDQSQ